MGWWRLVLAWCVIAVHTSYYHEFFRLDIGTIAVASFFFVSGFLMPLAFDANYTGSDFWKKYRRFFVNRLLRLFPIYWLSLLVILFGKLLIAHGLIGGNPLRPEGPLVLAYAQNFLLLGLNQSKLWGAYYRFNNPAWTLDIELQYYVLAPILLLAFRKSRRATAAVLIAFSALSIYLFLAPVGLVDVDRSLLAWSFFFFAGFGVYLSPTIQAWLKNRLLIALFTAFFTLGAIMTPQEAPATLLATMAFVSVSAALVVLQKERRFGRLDRLAGDLSYPTYILQLPVLAFSVHYLAIAPGSEYRFFTFAVNTLMNIVAVTAVAACALKLVARPVDLFRERIKGGLAPKAVVEAESGL